MQINKINIQNDVLIIKSLKHISSINQYINNYTFEKFVNDSKTIDACITRLTQIGELERRFDKGFKEAFNEIPWKDINGLRNIVVHNYDGIMYDTLWQTVQDDLPELEKMYVNLLINNFEISLNDLSFELDFNYLPYCQELLNEIEFQL